MNNFCAIKFFIVFCLAYKIATMDANSIAIEYELEMAFQQNRQSSIEDGGIPTRVQVQAGLDFPSDRCTRCNLWTHDGPVEHHCNRVCLTQNDCLCDREPVEDVDFKPSEFHIDATMCEMREKRNIELAKLPERVLEDLKCSICLEWFWEPMIGPCGHTFCKECIGLCMDALHAQMKKCPVCREDWYLTLKGLSYNGDDRVWIDRPLVCNYTLDNVLNSLANNKSFEFSCKNL